MLRSTGHSGKHGHEFLEFEYSHGRLRYANNSNYRNDSLIRKESTRLLPKNDPSISNIQLTSVDWSFDCSRTQTDRRDKRHHKVTSILVNMKLPPANLMHREDDSNWPKPNIVGKQELEIRLGKDHISFHVKCSKAWISSRLLIHTQTAKIGSLMDVSESEDPEGLRVFYYLVQDVKVIFFLWLYSRYSCHCNSVSSSLWFRSTSKSSLSRYCNSMYTHTSIC